MILDKIINECTWVPTGIQCSNPGEAKLFHKFLREAVLDRHIYINKVIGFSISSSSNSRAFANNYIARHVQIGDSYPEVMSNLLDKIFLNTQLNEITINLSAGKNYIDVPSTLYTNKYLCNCLKDTAVLKLKLLYDCGYKEISVNSKSIGSKYYPCYTDYSLAPFVRILPITDPTSNIIPVRYYNGISPIVFRGILTAWKVAIDTNNIKMEEETWLNSYR